MLRYGRSLASGDHPCRRISPRQTLSSQRRLIRRLLPQAGALSMSVNTKSANAKKKIGVLGASGYTGADAVRLLARHPGVEISALTANTHAGKAMEAVFPHFFMLDLPILTEWEKVDWSTL